MTYTIRSDPWELQTIITPVLNGLRGFAYSPEVQTGVGASITDLRKLQAQLDEALASVAEAFAERDKTCFSTSSDITG